MSYEVICEGVAGMQEVLQVFSVSNRNEPYGATIKVRPPARQYMWASLDATTKRCTLLEKELAEVRQELAATSAHRRELEEELADQKRVNEEWVKHVESMRDYASVHEETARKRTAELVAEVRRTTREAVLKDLTTREGRARVAREVNDEWWGHADFPGDDVAAGLMHLDHLGVKRKPGGYEHMNYSGSVLGGAAARNRQRVEPGETVGSMAPKPDPVPTLYRLDVCLDGSIRLVPTKQTPF